MDILESNQSIVLSFYLFFLIYFDLSIFLSIFIYPYLGGTSFFVEGPAGGLRFLVFLNAQPAISTKQLRRTM